MPLPSQYARPQSRSTHMYRRRRPRRTLTAVVLLMLLAATIAVWTWTRADSPQQTSAETAPAVVIDDDRAADRDIMADRLSSQSPPRATTDQTPRITMGQRVPLDASPRGTSGGDQAPTERTAAPASAPASEPQSQPRPQTQTPSPQPQRQQSPSQSQPPSDPPPAATGRVADRLRAGMDLLASNKPVEARRVLTQALLTPGIDRRTAREIRETLTELNQRLVFGREIVPDDPFAFGYTIRPGDTLARITSRENAIVDWRFIQRINGIARPEAIRAGQQLKLVQGPFHAVVVKQDYRIDVFLGEGSDRVYVCSFPVGLGEYDSTPIGRFRVRQNSKLINPAWTNPRTGEHFTANDPKNPIGNRWIGLEGITDTIRDLAGYGIHGTIEPESIGRQESMGCIRLHNEHVELLYEMLVERESTVEIVERQ